MDKAQEQAKQHLAEIQRVLRELAAERRRAEKRRVARPNIMAEVRAILRCPSLM